jgi:hypothetical protein
MFDHTRAVSIFFCLLFFVLVSEVAASEYRAAQKLGKVDTNLMGCPAGAFWDPRNGGECWSCPAGAKRTVFPVNSAKACLHPPKRTHGVAKQLERNLTICPAGTFLDPRNGGECWSCAAGYKRTVHPVTGGKACSKRIGKKNGKARYSHDTGSLLKSCGKGKFANVGSTKCYTCPSGYRHNPAVKVNKTGVCYKPAYTKHVGASLERSLSGLKCSAGFYDPIDGGSCWTCPNGYKRSVSSVKSAKACVKSRPAKYLKADFKQKKRASVDAVATGLKGIGCSRYGKTAFFDLIDGGSCWSCPGSNPVRTLYPVDSAQACASKNCGSEGGRPCYITERFPSCHKGLVEDPIKNQCVKPKNLACVAMVKTIAGINKAIRKANAAGSRLQDEAIDKIPGIKGLLRFIENQNTQVQKQLGKVTNRLDFSRVNNEFRTLVEQNGEVIQGVARAAETANRSKHALEALFTDPNMICAGNTDKIDRRLRDLGLARALKPQTKDPVFNISVGQLLGIRDAHAVSSTSQVTFDFNVSFPYNGLDWGFGMQYATDFRGKRGMYFMHSTSKGWSKSDSSDLVKLGSAGLAVGWNYSGRPNPCAGDVYSWGVPINLFGPLGVGVNCSGFGGLALSVGADLKSVGFLTPASGGPVALPKTIEIAKPELGGGIGYEGAFTLWDADGSRHQPGIY